MIILGLVLLLLGLLVPALHVLLWVAILLILCGVVFAALAATSHGGRRHYW